MRIEFLADHLDCRDTIASWFMKEWGARYPERTLECWAETQTYINKDKLPLTLIAIEDGEIIGTVCLRSDGMSTHSEWKAWLSYLYVPESHRGKGIAKALVAQAEFIAKDLGLSELHLFTRLEKPKLYIDMGWRLTDTEDYRGGRVTIMNKNVDVKPQKKKTIFSFFREHPYITSTILAIGITKAYSYFKRTGN